MYTPPFITWAVATFPANSCYFIEVFLYSCDVPVPFYCLLAPSSLSPHLRLAGTPWTFWAAFRWNKFNHFYWWHALPFVAVEFPEKPGCLDSWEDTRDLSSWMFQCRQRNGERGWAPCERANGHTHGTHACTACVHTRMRNPWGRGRELFQSKWTRNPLVHFCSLLSLEKRKKNILLVCALSRSFLGCLLTPCHLTLSGGGWGLELMFTQGPPGIEPYLCVQSLPASQTKTRGTFSPSLPARVKQFQLWLLMNFWGEGKKVLACFLGVVTFIGLSAAINLKKKKTDSV